MTECCENAIKCRQSDYFYSKIISERKFCPVKGRCLPMTEDEIKIIEKLRQLDEKKRAIAYQTLKEILRTEEPLDASRPTNSVAS